MKLFLTLFASIFLIAAIATTLVFTVACSPATIANLWETAGELADNYINAYAPGWQDQATFDAAWAKALASIKNFKSGSPCAEVITLVNDAVAIFDTIPAPTQQDKLLLSTISASINIVAAHYSQCSPGTGLKASVKRAQLPPGEAPAKTASDLKKQWKKLGGPGPRI